MDTIASHIIKSEAKNDSVTEVESINSIAELDRFLWVEDLIPTYRLNCLFAVRNFHKLLTT